MDHMRKQYVKEKDYEVVEMWKREWWSLYKTDLLGKRSLREPFSLERPFRAEPFLEKKTKSGSLFVRM